MAQLFIPDDYADLAAAAAAAVTGDEIIFRNGTYTGANNKDLALLAAINLTIRSENNNPELCIIDLENNGRFVEVDPAAGDINLYLKGLWIKNGNVNGHGGAVYAANNPTGLVDLENMIIEDCVAAVGFNGGGIFHSDCLVICHNCLIKGCEADDGGGVNRTGGVGSRRLECRQTTIVDNTARGGTSGGGIRTAGVNEQDLLLDCIVWGNTTADNNGHQIANGGPQFVLIQYSCYRNLANDIVGNVTPTSSITTDPEFVTFGTRTHLLSQAAAGETPQSPCVDTGSQSAAAADMDDKTTRSDADEDGGTVDMGFHWFGDAACVTEVCGAPGAMLKINNMLAQINCLLYNHYAGLIAGLDPDCIVRALLTTPDGALVTESVSHQIENPLIYTVTLTVLNTQYSITLPAGIRGFSMQARQNRTVRFAFTAGLVAASTEPFASMRNGAPYTSPPLKLTAPLTVYFASGLPNTDVEIVAWS